MKQLLAIVAGVVLAAGELGAQTAGMRSAFQQIGWMATHEYRFDVLHMNRPDGQTGPVHGKPFSGTEVRHVIQTLVDGTHVDQMETTASYRDAQGRMRAENRDHVLIYDPVSGFVYNLDPRTKTYRKTPISDRTSSATIAATASGTWVATDDSHPPAYGDVSARRGIMRGSPPAVTEDLGRQVINGIQSNGARMTITIPKGTFGNDRDVKVVNERWYSDDLQVLVKSSNSDPRFGVTTYELANILQAPPDQGLLRVPSDYRLSEESRVR